MKQRVISLFTLFIIVALVLAGCQTGETNQPVVEEPVVEEPAVEEPETEEPVAEDINEFDLGTEENPLIWALVPSSETNTVLTGFQNVTDLIYQETGLVIEPFVATEYAGVIEAMTADPPKAHIASLATFAYMLASERGVAEAELVALRYGSASYNGQIFVRTDSGITSIAELSGKSFCGVDPLSTSGWIIPSITLAANGINPDTDLESVVFSGSHDAAVAAVYNGECDAGSSFVDARSNLTEDYPDIMEEITVIEVSVDIPNDGVQYHPSISRGMRDQINDVLLTIHETEEGAEALETAYSWTELAKRDDTFYEPFRQILDAAGIDISQFMN
jgi:phosphonate transport system substrate-binding protein